MLYAPLRCGPQGESRSQVPCCGPSPILPVATMLHECSVPTRAIFLLDPQHQYVTKQRSPWQTFGMVSCPRDRAGMGPQPDSQHSRGGS